MLKNKLYTSFALFFWLLLVHFVAGYFFKAPISISAVILIIIICILHYLLSSNILKFSKNSISLWMYVLACTLFVVYILYHSVSSPSAETVILVSKKDDYSESKIVSTKIGQDKYQATENLVKEKENLSRAQPTTGRMKPITFSRDLHQLVQDVNQLAIDKDWENFLISFDQVGDKMHDMAQMFLHLAVQNGAPESVISQLLNVGAELDFQVYSYAVINNDLESLKVLEKLGLDLQLKDREGGSAINTALRLAKSPEVFDYLVDRGVSIASSGNSKDAMEVALEKALSDRVLPVYYLRKLAEMKVDILPKHEKLLRRLESQNNASYAVLIELVPQLANQSLTN